jgi:broad-specificity NMP kinase
MARLILLNGMPGIGKSTLAVVPQLLARADQIDRFADAAAEWTTGTARHAGSSIARVGRVSSRHTSMDCGRSSPHRPATHVLRSREGAVEQIYRDLVDLLATHGGTTP